MIRVAKQDRMFTVRGRGCGGDDNDDNGSGEDRMVSLLKQEHLDWSDQQRRILTDNGNAEIWYHPERGYPFTENELPHYYLQHNKQQQSMSSREIFLQWKLQQQSVVEPTNHVTQMLKNTHHPIVGIWERTLFYGGLEYTTNRTEYTYNIQTSTLFIDLRIPKTRDEILMVQHQLQQEPKPIQSLYDMNIEQLRYYARQHIFAGYTKLQRVMSTADDNSNSETRRTSSSGSEDHTVVSSFPYCATRYHCIDWNYVGIPRSRPNKWYIELPLIYSTNRNNNDDDDDNATMTTTETRIDQWKEWAYATNQYQQHYYCECWKRRCNDDLIINHPSSRSSNNNKNNNDDPKEDIFLILRKCSDPDGIIIILNDHIMYCIDRVDSVLPFTLLSSTLTSMVAVVDELLIKRNDLDVARKYLSMQGGHGRWVPTTSSTTSHHHSNPESLHNGDGGSWILDHCIEFWKQGHSFFSTNDEITIVGTSVEHCTIQWKKIPPYYQTGEGSNKNKNHHHTETEWSIFDTNIDSVASIRLLLLSGPNSLHTAPQPVQHHTKL